MINSFCEETFLRDLEQLVNIDSGTGTAAGLALVAGYLEERYAALGYTAEQRLFSSELGPCLEVRSHPDEAEIDLLLIGHMDTVFPAGTAAQRPFTLENGIARGPGVADMKGGLALGLQLAAFLLRERPELRVCFAHNCDEEIGSPSSGAWLRALAEKSRCCLDFEPGRPEGSFVHARKGVARLALEFRAIAAHAGVNPGSGASAVVELSRWICHFAGKSGGALVNFGVIRGGSAYNVVADAAEAELDIRYDAPEELEEVQRELSRLQNTPFDPRVRVTLREQAGLPPMVCDSGGERLKQLLEEAGRSVGVSVRFQSTGGASDASMVSFAGVPTMDGCGPAGGNLHGQEEYLDVSSAAPRLRLLAEFCKRL